MLTTRRGAPAPGGFLSHYRREAPTSTDQLLEERAMAALERHAHFHGRSRFITCHCNHACLRLDGCVPCYYLKQLAQEAVRNLEGVQEVDNQIVVASPVGEVGDDPDFYSEC